MWRRVFSSFYCFDISSTITLALGHVHSPCASSSAAAAAAASRGETDGTWPKKGVANCSLPPHPAPTPSYAILSTSSGPIASHFSKDLTAWVQSKQASEQASNQPSNQPVSLPQTALR